jgi:hypothetical protein
MEKAARLEDDVTNQRLWRMRSMLPVDSPTQRPSYSYDKDYDAVLELKSKLKKNQLGY